MKEGFLDLEDERAYVLRELEVFNWGPFRGKHRAEFDERGTAIIGSTGSGKTTLVDALMTLLAEKPRYNLASTGGHDKNDRTLISYIRGYGGGAGGDQVARPGRTVTALAATYENSQQTLRAMAIFWTDSTSNSQQDLKRRWLFAEDPEQTLDVLLRHWQDHGARGLMKHGKETAGLRPFESKRAYLAHVRKVFDVGENAFNLLNRAAGLKQLDSVDAIFRELVLDDKSAFGRALEVAGDFDNLAEIHKELEDARRQRDSLAPIAEQSKQLDKLNGKLEEARQIKALTPRWFAGLGVGIWEKEQERLDDEHKQASGKSDRLQGEMETAIATEQDLQERYLAIGGGDIQQLEQAITAQGELLRAKEFKAREYQSIVRALDLDDDLTETHFLRNRERLNEKRPQLEQALQEIEHREADARSHLRDAKQRCQELETTIREVKASPGSNIPLPYQHFRHDLANHLGLRDEDLPYVAELVEVKAEETDWRGAIERAIGSNRLRILVPEGRTRDALRWVNQRDNKLHVRLQEARLGDSEKDYFHDSFIYKLTIKSHPLRLALENLLAHQDYHCVNSADALRNVAHGLTKEGTMSGVGGRFDKQDQRRLNEGWLTGFDNQDQLKALVRDLLKGEEQLKSIEPDAKAMLQKRKARESDLRLLDTVTTLEFEQIDAPGAHRLLDASNERLKRLLAPDSEASAARETYEIAQGKTQKLRGELSEIEKLVAVLESKIEDANKSLAECREQQGAPLTEQESNLIGRILKTPDELTAGGLSEAQRRAIDNIDRQIEKLIERIRNLEQRLVSLMEKARALNEGAYVDAGNGLVDIPIYVAELEKLIKEALPEKEKRFLEYLNLSSDQGVTQLLAHIDQEVSNIEDRIADLNHTLAKVDFRENHYLQLQPQRLNEATIRELEKARRHLRDAVLKEDEGRSHFRALQNIVTILREAGNNRHLVGSRALLDPRYRLQFFVVEVDRQSGKASTGRTGSQSDSGGEKELMSSHILTASLSYALCPSGASRPLYGTIVLDEAFSKSSQSAARLIVDALKVFGLYPVFVTPNKEISLLKKYTRRAICVQRTATGSSLATISWEKLAELQPDSERS